METTTEELTRLQHITKEQKQRIRELERKEQWLHLIFDYAPINIYLKDRERRFIAVNREFEKNFGVTNEEIVGKPNFFADLSIQELSGSHDQRVFETGQPSVQDELIGSRTFRVMKHPIFDEHGVPIELIGFDMDITDLTHAQRRLEEKNRELEAYASTVAHDLKAPLRQIQGFIDILLEDYCQNLGQTVREYLEYIQTSVQRLSSLISDLLTLARLGRDEAPFSQIDVQQLIVDMKAKLPGYDHHVEFVIHTDETHPMLEGHRLTLEQIFQNLLDNALKFVHPDRRPRIEVSVEREGAYRVISVCDNGIGIAPPHQEHIFGIFKRLHEHDAYAGTGIGLAIVKKGVALHHGSLWVESEPEQGSTFFIKLPLKQTAA